MWRPGYDVEVQAHIFSYEFWVEAYHMDGENLQLVNGLSM